MASRNGNGRLNGHAPKSQKQSPLSAKAQDAQRRIQEARLEAQAIVAEAKLRRLKESALLDFDFLGPWRERLNAGQHDPAWFPIGHQSSRRHGQHFPFFQTEIQLAWIRDLSRIVYGTSNHAKGLMRGLVSFTVGTGFAFKVTPKAGTGDAGKAADTRITAFLDCWAKKVRWGERQQESYRRTHRDGDGLLVMDPDDGWLKLRFRWPEQLRQPPDTDFREWSFGVHADPDDAESRFEYYFASMDDPAEGEYRDAGDVVHLMDRETDSGIKRGLPLFSFDCKDSLDTAARLTRNLGEGSAVRAAIAMIRQHAEATEEDVQAFAAAQADFKERRPYNDTHQNVSDIQPGTVYDVSEGMEFAGVPSNEEAQAEAAVVDLLVRSACSRVNAPEWLGSSNAQNMGAYTSSLVAESPFVKGVIGDQDYYRTRFLEVVNRALAVAASHGVIDPADLALVDVDLVPPSPEVRNRVEEAQTAAIEIPLGVESRQRYCESQNRDFEQIEADNQAYADKFGDPGQTLPMPGTDQKLGGGAGTAGPFGSLPESLRESLLESGFTGTVTDSAGRERHYVDGKQVAKGGDDGGGDKDKPAKPSPEELKALHKELAAKMPELTESQFEAAGDYTGGSYVEINQSLREGREAKKGAKVIPELAAAIDSAPTLGTPVTVHRGIRLTAEQEKAFLEKLKAAKESGQLIEEPGFMSTSINPDVATGFATGGKGAEAPLVFEIAATKGLYLGESVGGTKEMEFLLQKGSKFRVVGYEPRDGYRVVKLEQVL